MKIPKTTVNRIFNLWRKTGNIRRRKPPGRPRKITTRLRRQIRRTAVRFPLATSREIAQKVENQMEIENSPSPSRIRAILVEDGLRARCCPKKWVISKINRIKRLKWAKIMLELSDEDWQRVVFTDESSFQGGNKPQTARCWKPQDVLNNFPVQQERWGPKVLVWGAISWEGIFGFEFVTGKMDSKAYKELLGRRLNPYLAKFQDGELFWQQDNAPAHTAGEVTDFLRNTSINVLPWPAQSPDLNLIENVWNTIKRKLKYSYDTQIELRADVLRVWNDVSVSYVKKLYASMRSRLRAVIRARGGPTKY
jgi:transposase